MRLSLTTRNTLLAATSLALVGLFTGCGIGTGAPPSAISIPAMQGKVFGGQQPVSGSTIQLYAAGVTGYGGASASLIGSTVLTNASGGFGITGAYTCPSASTQVYITATGGNAGSGPNPNLGMMAALGSCGSLSSSTFIYINEITTIGSVYALSPFMSGITSVATSATNVTGLQDAFSDVATLVNTANGTTPGPALSSNASISTTEINTLADILAACVNSGGGTAGDSTPCGKLFTATNPGTAPTDTITAALNIARHPALNVALLYNLVAPTSPFQPTLAAQPNDFTVAVKFTGSGLSFPSAVAADASGNVWVTNATGNSVTEFTHTGATVAGSPFGGSFSNPYAIAIDSLGGPWIVNKSNNTLTHLNSSGLAVGGSPFSGGGMSQPSSVSIDSLGNVWIGNTGSASISAFSSTGTAISGAGGFTAPSITNAVGIAVSPH